MGTGDWIFLILGALIILALIVWAVSPRGDCRRRAPATAESPRQILDRRLASGALTAEQYEQLRETLGNASPSTLGSPPEPALPTS